MKDIRAYLREGQPLLFDGAMGTYYAGLHGPELCEMANLWHPEDISSIHSHYLDSGCQAIKTNTYAASVDLAHEPGLAREIIKAGCEVARQAAYPRDAWVFACIGPSSDDESTAETYRMQADLFLEEGMRCFLAETLRSDAGIPELAAYLKEKDPESFLIVSFAVDPEGMTKSGFTGQELVDRMDRLPAVDCVGFNCASGPAYLLRYLKQLRLPEKPLSVMPNAGYPSVQGRKVHYKGSPAYFGEKLAEIVQSGASIVGGCCGTTPEHIAAAAAALSRLAHEQDMKSAAESGASELSQAQGVSMSPISAPPVPKPPVPTVVVPVVPEASVPEVPVPEASVPATPVPEASGGQVQPPRVSVQETPRETAAASPGGPGSDSHRERFGEKLDAGKKVLAVELDPPADDDVTFFLEGAQALWNAGADAVTIADCPIGRPRADSSLLACKLKREYDLEPLPHMTCRDRNLNATKALLLGLSMEGVHNVLLVTGDPIPSEHRDEVKSVFNFNSRMLARYVHTLNESVLKHPFRMFGALNVNARDFRHQLMAAFEKEDAGMSGFLTQPVLSKEALHNLRMAREMLKGKILAGIFPVVSFRNACFLNNEIAGMRVGDDIVAMYEGKSREEGEDLATELSVRIARDVIECADGLYLMTPFRRVALMERILTEIRREGIL